MNKVRLYPQLELLNTWAIDRTRFSPDATEPPLCLRCGRRSILCWLTMPSAGILMSISAMPAGQMKP